MIIVLRGWNGCSVNNQQVLVEGVRRVAGSTLPVSYSGSSQVWYPRQAHECSLHVVLVRAWPSEVGLSSWGICVV